MKLSFPSLPFNSIPVESMSWGYMIFAVMIEEIEQSDAQINKLQEARKNTLKVLEDVTVYWIEYRVALQIGGRKSGVVYSTIVKFKVRKAGRDFAKPEG